MQSLLKCVFITTWFFLNHVAHAQIAYPEDVVMDKKKVNLQGRKPLYSPSRCKQNELLYPGDQEDDWICDCAPAALYYPETDACYQAFRRGPCEANQMLVLQHDKIIPECRSNPCKDGQFMIHHKCYEFGSNDDNPCPMKEYTYVLGVDPKSLLVSCVKLSVHLASRFGDEYGDNNPLGYDLEAAIKCARGSQLLIEGKCKT